MYNSLVEWADSICTFDNLGSAPNIVNSEFLRMSYGGGSCAVVGDTLTSGGMLFDRNSVYLFNAFTAVVPGPRSVITMNRIGRQGAACDGALIHVHIGPQNGTVISRNWLYDAQVRRDTDAMLVPPPPVTAAVSPHTRPRSLTFLDHSTLLPVLYIDIVIIKYFRNVIILE